MEKIRLSIENINKKYDNHIIFKNFNIDFYIDNVNCILGKSGCGKTTLLNIISGIIENDTCNLNIKESSNKIGSKLDVSYIFQEDRLIDWLTVEENIKIVVNKYYSKTQLDKICDEYLDLVGIIKYKNFYPQMLSGGLRQRVNIARAFIYPSKTIIMDEPFKSIDAKNKQIIMDNFKDILKKEKRTVLFVTHDIEEALFLADNIFILGDSPMRIKKELKNSSELEKNEVLKLI
ncbi:MULTISPECIES: ABC transporter ATP-binding protein [unclassified Clostridioides]|uniref:ABC transporter ATP-binding protein n=1 Tax=unclassified Clostridioides TaxID=2635829 RepID=UPI001D0C8E0D|nr:ABC transporter ATP-binding protein [Clostridioides sp. ES-S-0001-02]MCC0681549.1 ABC transporter ATP-binding protein [Clostridioides sp. ES-S-0005-03]MCC0696796.1 ABC transporter ATP-binding protein [Clostridioides sp. ES-S-0048-02]MCC0764659.1 ABC transporter ATP-binding protein [Clostridioides sp. ES-S-0006-03]UDN48420.1 ABC transporter ATP-binding protein [Clostridioides sp. ES-S-0173-01]UDN57599.1 ABC transporter ATP-binding protein [Clostridioides sp. ES-S-0010-02]